MIFRTMNRQDPETPDLMMNGRPIKRVRSYRYLGFEIDDRLTYTGHVELIKSKIFPFIAMIKRTRYLIPTEHRLRVYYAYVHSHLVHMISIWGHTYDAGASEQGGSVRV